MAHVEWPARGVTRGLGKGRVDRDATFAEFLAARQPHLLRTAYLLTGDRAAAEELLRGTLATLYLSWGRVAAGNSPEGEARRLLFATYLSPWRRLSPGVRRPAPTGAAVEPGEDTALWARIQALPPRQRAVLVLCCHEELDEVAAAEVLGTSAGRVRSLAARARSSALGGHAA